MPEDVKAADRWQSLNKLRQPVLDRVRDLCKLSLPFYIQEEGDDEGTAYDTPWQSLGARAVNGLATKLHQTLFPIEVPFFRYEPNAAYLKKIRDDLEAAAAEAGQQLDSNALKSIEDGVVEELMEREFTVQSEMARMGLSAALYRSCLALVLTGGNVLYIPKEGKPKTYKLDQFVLSRDGDGTITELIVLEYVDRRTLIKAGVSEDTVAANVSSLGKGTTNGDLLKLYTYVYLNEEGTHHVEIQQLSNGAIVGEPSEFPIDSTPWIAPRFFEVEGQDYGRGQLELYAGDFRTLEHLSQALSETAVAMAKALWGVNPNATVTVEELAKAKNLDFIYMEEGSVWPVQLDKARDLATVKTQIDALVQSLSLAFVLNTAIQRQAERVTAEEIRYMAEQLENELGGLYSTLSANFQIPVLKAVVARLEHQSLLKKFPKDKAEPMIVAGFDGLGRSHRARRLEIVVAQAMQIPASQAHLDFRTILEEIFKNNGLNSDRYLKSEQQVQAEQQQAQQQAGLQEAISKGTGPAIAGMLQQQ